MPPYRIKKIVLKAVYILTNSAMCSILVVDNQAIIRCGIQFLLREYFEVLRIDEASDGSAAFRKIRQTPYDLVIMDINLPETDTFNVLAKIYSMKPTLPILIFTTKTEYAFVRRYLRCGVKGFLSKLSDCHNISLAILSILNGENYFSEGMLEKRTKDRQADEGSDPFASLSNREFEIVRHLINGESVTQIADSLNIHTSTVGTHKGRIFDKLKVNNLVVLRELARMYRHV